ncbi:histone-lysine N-methyltransferase 2B-like isoform X1 [Triticum dicoccoides]|uniref:histone-lysine N-methyltransferase 2B-like isoform X1 n=2 Tax=Triticum dicoccoides TaxID=85692 RepID=UPI00188E4DB4|nr:histone-lysine N-methyltransferase 2B-like isoform X1 [Triticum dicoccoides]
MLAVAAGQATLGEPSSSAAAAAAVPKRRDPTPDHPPYSWMIEEAIQALGEDGGSAESAISGFIRDRYPGVPAAHDRFLRYYLAKHVAEGLFVCAAPGRYSCCSDDEPQPELALTEVLAAAAAPAKAGPPPTEPKRARGRPRKDDSLVVVKRGRGRPRRDDWQTAAVAVSAGPLMTGAKRGPGPPKKDGSPAAGAKRGRGRPRKDGLPANPASGKKFVSGSPSAMPKRRGRSRLLTEVGAADVPGEALVTDKKDNNEAPSATDKNHGEPRELALVIVNDGSGAALVTEEDGGEAPAAKRPLLAKEPAAFSTPECSTQPCKLPLVAADENSAPALASDKEGDTEAPFVKHKRRRRTCRSEPAKSTCGSASTSIADKKAGGNVASAPPKGRGWLRKPTLMDAAADEITPNEARSALVKPRRKPRKQFLLNFYDEVPNNPKFCVLALPAQVPGATKAP